MNRSKAFRTFHNQIANASDLRALIEVIKEAYQARSRKNINIKMFTALNTLYVCKRANLESTAMRITKERDGQLRTFMPAVPVIAMAKQIAVRDLQQLALKLHTLPAQEQERVRKVFCEERPELYQRIVDGLTTRIRTASQSKRMYFRFAFYVKLETGIPNEPLSMIHLLTAADRAVMWQKLKASTGVDQPKQTRSLPESQDNNPHHHRVHSACLPLNA